MMRTALNVVLITLGMFLLIEQSYRVFSVGLAAFNPAKMNSFNTLLGSGLIKSADDPSMYYELKPNLDSMLRGVPLKTNSAGLADKEYSLEKPANTYRVVVLGSSWTMPASIPVEQSYHWLLEDNLNALADELGSDMNFEVINFGVESYGVGELVGTLRHKAMAYDPDLVVMAVTRYTGNVLWVDYEEPFDPPPGENVFFNSYILAQFGLSPSPLGRPLKRIPIPEAQKEYRYRQQVAAALNDVVDISKKGDAEVILLTLSFSEWFFRVSHMFDWLDGQLDYTRINTTPVLTEFAKANKGTRYKVSRVDSHPNELAHSMYADMLLEDIKKRPEAGLAGYL